jgi:hypothetical protein
MWMIFDNLAATIMATAITLIIISTMTRVREASVEQLSIHVAKTHALDLAEWLEDDVSSLGANFDSTTVRFLLPQMLDGNTSEFTFLRDTLGGAPNFLPVRVETRYALQESDQITIADSTVQMFQLVRSVRYQDGAGWSIWTEDGLGRLVNDEPETVFIKVDFSIIPPFVQDDSYLNEVSWGNTTRLRPY